MHTFCVVTVVRAHVLYCDSVTREKKFERTVLGNGIQFVQLLYIFFGGGRRQIYIVSIVTDY